MLTQAEMAQFNRSAEFLEGSGETSPGIKVAGVLVTVRVDHEGTLIISADFDEADPRIEKVAPHYGWRYTPVSVRMSGQEVWTDEARTWTENER